MLGRILRELRDGRGFALLRGMPTDEFDFGDLEKLYWGMCTHLGIGITQNSEAGLIHYITDCKLRPQEGARVLEKPGIVKLHVDLSDCAGLFCVRQAPDDPPSMVASSMTVYNEILRQHPEYLPRLYRGFPWDRKSPYLNEEPPSSYFNIPAYSAMNGVVTCRFHPGWIRSGLDQTGQALTDGGSEMFDFIAEVALANSYPYPFHQGDVAWVNNYTVFHGRAAFDPVVEESGRRVLLRLWLDGRRTTGRQTPHTSSTSSGWGPRVAPSRIYFVVAIEIVMHSGFLRGTDRRVLLFVQRKPVLLHLALAFRGPSNHDGTLRRKERIVVDQDRSPGNIGPVLAIPAAMHIEAVTQRCPQFHIVSGHVAAARSPGACNGMSVRIEMIVFDQRGRRIVSHPVPQPIVLTMMNEIVVNLVTHAGSQEDAPMGKSGDLTVVHLQTVV